MSTSLKGRSVALSVLAIIAVASAPRVTVAQGQGGALSGPMREAAQLDLDGNTAGARRLLQMLIDSAATPAARRKLGLSGAR